MALGIGVNTGIFTVLNGLVLRDLPAPDSEQLVSIHQEIRGIRRGNSGYGGGFATYEYGIYRDRPETLSGVMGYSQPYTAVLGGEGAAREVLGGIVTCNYFSVLKQLPELGRSFSPDACEDGAASAEVVLSHDLWVNAFGSDDSVIETDITLNGNRFTVVGVAPEGFHGVDLVRSSFFVPIGAQPFLSPNMNLIDADGISWLTLVGRLRPGFGRQQATAELAVLARQIDQQEPGRTTRLLVNRATAFGGPTRMRTFVMGGSGLVLAAFFAVLIIACSNVANLVLARGDSRMRELSVRVALGATRGRLIRQLLLESVMISVMGGVIGTVLALWVFQWLTGFVLSSMTGTIAALRLDPSPDARVFAFAFALALGTGIISGLAPALQMSRPNLRSVMEKDSAGAGQQTRGRLQGPIVAVQVALSMVLVITTALLIRGLYVVQTAELGFDYRRLTVANVDLSGFGYDENRAAELQRQWIERVTALPGVEEVAQALITPLGGGLRRMTLRGPGQEESVMTTMNTVSANYFSVAGIPVVRGQTFSEAEVRSAVNTAVIVTESTARRFWPGQDPVGQFLVVPRIPAGGEDNLQVVGVAADVQVQRIGESDTSYIYLPAITQSQAELQLLIRSPLDAAELGRSIGTIVRDLDPDLLARVSPLEENIEFWRRLSRLAVSISLGLGGLALVLASIGVFGVISSVVGRRIREIGIRLALGADKRDVLQLILRKSLRPVAIGVVVGIVACIFVARAMSAMLFGVSTFDPYALVGASVLVMGAAIAASIVPARRAMSVDPMTTLRYE
jgi:predicted permease